jgi:hypothetical protein
MGDLDTMNELESFTNALSERHPIEIKYKDKSNFMKLLGFLLFFNKKFMTNYITTIGNTVYFPSEAFVTEHSLALRSVMAHEFYHINDANRTGKLLWQLLWLMPQALAILALIAILGVLWTPLLWFLVCLVFLVPWPAYWRKKYELGGYTMSLFMLNEHMKAHSIPKSERRQELERTAEVMDKNQFRSSYYYFMWPFGVRKELQAAIESILSGDILDTDEVFAFVANAFRQS